ncbi:TMEM175 family protein [Permianibacter aggregans]|uniref:Uncharacterized protein DUF1211 n=1 Tax=Permianibacter aggregans TaxID=1510150 RepID=A0A4R6UH67_9GAMM|nr:TMEM175 family protein [Permianibacter aggregans]QGX41613.1 DUF1211 domain-containing protein [Permianibacter aggregans]TDQ45682.1 uncharacterized protein DUF1211 [Permianibacter aggregans]
MRNGSRLEAFTDAAFAFALTLLAISGDEMPGSIAELKNALHQIPSFIVSAALLIMFWHAHQSWSKDYRSDDGVSILLTSVLVCTVLVYVYPLKMLFSGFFHWVTGGLLKTSYTATGPADISDLFAIYGYGFITMCMAMFLLYRHTIRQAKKLGLTDEQKFLAAQHGFSFLLLMSPGVLSLILTYTLPEKYLALNGMVYSLLGIIMPLYGVYSEKQYRAWRAARANVDKG